MNKMCAVFVGLLLTVYLSSQMVRAQSTNVSSTMSPTESTTVNETGTGKNGCERPAGAALLLPLAVGLLVLHGWSN